MTTNIACSTKENAWYRSAMAWVDVIGRSPNHEDTTRRLWGSATSTLAAGDDIANAQIGSIGEVAYDAIVTALNVANPIWRAQDESVTDLRAELREFVWSGNGYPTEGVDVTLSVSNPLHANNTPSNLLRTDKLDIPMTDNDGNLIETVDGWLFTPEVADDNGKLIIGGSLRGHVDNITDASSTPLLLVKECVEAGYSFAVTIFPFNSSTAVHDELPPPTKTLNYLRFFVEPVVRILNQYEGDYDNYIVCGMSGGGWTTSLMAGLDTRQIISADCSGSMPFYFSDSSWSGDRDFEQYLWGLSFDYLDFYTMGCSGGRIYNQTFNSGDTCCFIGDQYDLGPTYEAEVQAEAATYNLTIYTNAAHTLHADTRAALITLFDGV
jgi:hypothetical protein